MISWLKRVFRTYRSARQARRRAPKNVRYQARIESASKVPRTGRVCGFTTFSKTFRTGRVPRCLATAHGRGYGFGAEGDWKHARSCARSRSWARGCKGAVFMEDYTTTLIPKAKVLVRTCSNLPDNCMVKQSSRSIRWASAGRRSRRASCQRSGGPAVQPQAHRHGQPFRMIVA